jgi:hypothetical protein
MQKNGGCWPSAFALKLRRDESEFASHLTKIAFKPVRSFQGGVSHYKNSFFGGAEMHSTLRIFDGLEVVGGVLDRELFTIVEGLFTK